MPVVMTLNVNLPRVSDLMTEKARLIKQDAPDKGHERHTSTAPEAQARTTRISMLYASAEQRYRYGTGDFIRLPNIHRYSAEILQQY